MHLSATTVTRILRIVFLVWLVATASLLLHTVRRRGHSAPGVRRNFMQPRAGEQANSKADAWMATRSEAA
jgi:hypothetical protein